MSDEIQITESEIMDAAKSYRVVVPPDVPTHQYASYQRQAIIETLTRDKIRQQEQQQRLAHQAEIKANLAEIDRQNAERDAKLTAKQKEKARADELESVCRAFFAGNPGASESDWNRQKTRLLDAAREQRTLEQLRGRASETDAIKTSLKESGKYGDVL